MASDWVTYEIILRDVPSIKDYINNSFPEHILDNIEIGFLYLMVIIKSFTDNQDIQLQILTLFISVVNYYILVKFTSSLKEVKYKSLLILIFISQVIYRDFDLLRQSLAASLMILAISLHAKNYIYYLCCIIFASTFHISALIFLPLVLLFYWKPSKNSLVIILIVFIFTNVFKYSITPILIDIFLKLDSNIFGVVKLLYYLEVDENQKSLGIISFVYVFLLVILIIDRKKIYSLEGKYVFIVNLYVSTILIYSFIDIRDLADRLTYLFNIGVAFMIVYSVRFIIMRSFVLGVVYFCFILFLPIARFYRIVSVPDTYQVLIPYRNIMFYDRNIDVPKYAPTIKK